LGEKGGRPDLSGSDLHIAVVVARYNEDVTKRLLRGATEALKEHGVAEPDVYWVPGALELPVTALTLAEKGQHDAIVCLGCVIRGETFHFEVVAGQAAATVASRSTTRSVAWPSIGPIACSYQEAHCARSGVRSSSSMADSDVAESAWFRHD